MLFNSLDFLIFLSIVFLVYWKLLNKNINKQNLFLLIASYVFYGWWDWRFLSLIIFISVTNYIIGRLIHTSNAPTKRKLLYILCITINLVILGFFKYFNFFIDSFSILLTEFGLSANINTLNIILPVGISFYTFQTLSYTIDIYRKEMTPSKNPIAFFAFVSFFPKLVAGPIERAKDLLPQFEKPRTFNYDKATDGMRQVLLGMFKKIVIADNLSSHVEYIFANSKELNGSILLIGVLLFAVQVYCDFSGYSDIAIGTARLFGFNLLPNFKQPYFSTNITDFWRRWHISLSTWFRDYLYMPIIIRTRNWKSFGVVFSLMITFILCGFWHGAKWTFIVFGFWHGLLLSYEAITIKARRKLSKRINITLYKNVSIILTFCFWLFTIVFFRADSLEHAFSYINSIFTDFNISGTNISGCFMPMDIFKIIVFIPLLFVAEKLQMKKLHTLDIKHFSPFWRITIYIGLIMSILLFSPITPADFIYFQF